MPMAAYGSLWQAAKDLAKQLIIGRDKYKQSFKFNCVKQKLNIKCYKILTQI